jgi:hypothetical protein
MRLRSTLVVALLLAACAGTQEESTESAGPPESAWEGRYYQPPRSTQTSDAKWEIELQSGGVAILREETCYNDHIREAQLRWEAVDDDSVRFTGSAEDADGFEWFFAAPMGDVIMSRTDDPERFEVTDGGFAEGPTVGPFKAGQGCLEIFDTNLGCGPGSAVVEC